MTQFVTQGCSTWVAGVSGSDVDGYMAILLRKGRGWLRRAQHPTVSDDAALLTFMCWEGLSDLYHRGRLEDDYLVAGDVLDSWVTDHDAELLCELLPLAPESPVGSMTPHVTAVHSFLLDVCAAIRERWEEHDEEERAA